MKMPVVGWKVVCLIAMSFLSFNVDMPMVTVAMAYECVLLVFTNIIPISPGRGPEMAPPH